VKYIFSVGNTVDPADAYRTFRGRDPEVSALMKERGFPVPSEGPKPPKGKWKKKGKK
jgi:peptidyl-dipeptidase Dcp